MTKNRLLSSASAAGMSLAAVPLVFAAVASHSAQPASPAPGTVKGVLELFGGPSPGRSYPQPGSVTARQHGKPVETVYANKHGHYSMYLAPGRYTLTGKPHGTSMTCRAEHAITVHSGQTTTHIDVVCPVP
jgi:hypothetical protein